MLESMEKTHSVAVLWLHHRLLVGASNIKISKYSLSSGLMAQTHNHIAAHEHHSSGPTLLNTQLHMNYSIDHWNQHILQHRHYFAALVYPTFLSSSCPTYRSKAVSYQLDG